MDRPTDGGEAQAREIDWASNLSSWEPSRFSQKLPLWAKQCLQPAPAAPSKSPSARRVVIGCKTNLPNRHQEGRTADAPWSVKADHEKLPRCP